MVTLVDKGTRAGHGWHGRAGSSGSCRRSLTSPCARWEQEDEDEDGDEMKMMLEAGWPQRSQGPEEEEDEPRQHRLHRGSSLLPKGSPQGQQGRGSSRVPPGAPSPPHGSCDKLRAPSGGARSPTHREEDHSWACRPHVCQDLVWGWKRWKWEDGDEVEGEGGLRLLPRGTRTRDTAKRSGSNRGHRAEPCWVLTGNPGAPGVPGKPGGP